MTGDICNLRTQRAKYIISDLVCTAMAFLLFNVYRCHVLSGQFIKTESVFSFLLETKMVWEECLFPPLMSLIYCISGFYNRPFQKSRLGIVSNTFAVSVVGSSLVLLLVLLNDASAKHIYYILVLALTFLLFVCLYIGRSVINSRFLRKLVERKVVYTAIILGDSDAAVRMAVQIEGNNDIATTRVEGFVHLPGERSAVRNATVWNFEEIKEICGRMCPDQLVIATESKDDRKVMRIVDRLITLDIPIKTAPNTLSFVTANIRMGDIMGTPLVDLSVPRMSDFGQNLKRCGDVLASLLALILLSPAYLALAVAVKRSSPGPVIYRQERIGKHHKPFHIYKFRSMYRDAEADGPQLSSDNDRRITRVGEMMRKYRLDELPQFWNVLKGDMSLVGPRPEREFFIGQIMERAPYYGLVFQVRPGITSWGMVKFGYASNVAQMVERSQYDLIYLNNMSILTDLKILAYTVRTVVTGKGK